MSGRRQQRVQSGWGAAGGTPHRREGRGMPSLSSPLASTTSSSPLTATLSPAPYASHTPHTSYAIPSHHPLPFQVSFQKPDTSSEELYEKPKQEPKMIFTDQHSDCQFYHLSGPSGISWLEHHPNLLPPSLTSSYLSQCLSSINFKSFTDRRGQPVPRRIAWFSEDSYTYSGIRHPAGDKWPDCVLELKGKIEERVNSFYRRQCVRRYVEQECEGERDTTTLYHALMLHQNVYFNSCLSNLYESGAHAVSWHADDEPPLGPHPLIASLSLGDTRFFDLREMPSKGSDSTSPPDIRIPLVSGSLLIMGGACQQDYQHRVPKEYHDRAVRVNLTYRIMMPEEAHSNKTQI